MRGVLNLESYFALAWVLLLLVRSRPGWEIGFTAGKQWKWLLLLAPLPFLPFLSFPFLADDYAHILNARALTPQGISALFTVRANDEFFRPAGYLSYALDARWAGMTPALWRVAGLAIHMVNVALVYLLCRQLQFSRWPALGAALLFAIHGSRPEAVTWVAARFDLLAVLFGLACLIFTLRGQRILAVASLVVALLSKETAFMTPLLALAVLLYMRFERSDIVRRTLPLFAVAVLVFAYRWQVLGGIGGYRNAENGSRTVLNFKLTSTLQAVFPRFWGTLLFPLNWTTRPGILLFAAMALSVASLLWLAGKPARRPLLLGVVFAFLCELPVHAFLSIGADLEKSRVLYFPSIGLAIVFAATVTSRRLLIPAACVLIFQCAALEHNLEIWKRVGYRARAACQVGLRDPPNVVDGVYFLHTGYPECLKFK